MGEEYVCDLWCEEVVDLYRVVEFLLYCFEVYCIFGKVDGRVDNKSGESNLLDVYMDGVWNM